MRVVIQPPDSSNASQAVIAREIQKAMEVLRSSYIPTDGGGSFERGGDMGVLSSCTTTKMVLPRCGRCSGPE